MTRRSPALISVLTVLATAFAAVPAVATADYNSVNALTGNPATQQSNPSGDHSSVNALTGDSASQQSSPSGEYSSLTAITGNSGTERPVQPAEGYSSVSSITGDQSPQPVSSPSIDAPDEGGFDWGDALIGALVASGVLGLAFVAARSVARHRRAATEPRV